MLESQHVSTPDITLKASSSSLFQKLQIMIPGQESVAIGT